MTAPHQRILPHFDISEQGLRELEIWLRNRGQQLVFGPWVYVGTYPTGTDTTRLSPPFQNGWENTGGGAQRLRFRRTVPNKHKTLNSLEIEGEIQSGALGTVITTLPADFRPRESGHLLGSSGDSSVAIYRLDTNGELSLVALAGGSAAPSGSAGGVLEGSYPSPGLAASVAGAGLAESSDVLSVNVDGSTIEISSDTLRVKASGIGANELASTAVSAGSYGDATHVGAFTVDADGRLTAASSVSISGIGATVLGARVYNSAVQSISASTDTALTFDTESFDTDTIHSTSSNTSRLTATTAGKYIIQAQVEWDASATGVRVAQIRLNGTTVIASNRKLSLSTGVTQMLVETVYTLAATDYVELIVNQTSLGSLNVDAGLGTTWFGMVAQAPQGAAGATGATGAAGSNGTNGTGVKLYDYEVSGSDKASIDTNVDGTTVANFAGYDILEVWMILRTDDAGAAVNADITVNNDTGSNYDAQLLYSNDTTPQATNQLAIAQWRPLVHGSGGRASYPSVVQISIPGYASTVFFKTGTMLESVPDGTAANQYSNQRAIGWRSTAAITRLKVTPHTGGAKLKVGSRLIVYGR